MECTVKEARTRKVAILAENGFNFPEVTQVMEALSGAGVHWEIISKQQGLLTGVDGRQLEVNKSFLGAASIMYDAVYVTGGRQCADALLAQGDAVHFINEAFKHAKAIGATNEGVDLLAASAIQGVASAGTAANAEPVAELGVVTMRNAADMGSFSQKFIEAIAQHRHWGRQKVKGQVPA